jgi:predicted RNA methylase
MKLKQLQSHLESVKPFKNPKIEFEQYPTSPHIASHMIFTAQEQFDDLESKTVADLGIGCGMLSIASSLMETGFNIGIDIDDDALDQTMENSKPFDLNLDLLKMDLREYQHRIKSDTVIMNPPFGTKTMPGIDIQFLKMATTISDHVIYSLHKSSTRNVSIEIFIKKYVLKKGIEFGFPGEVIANLNYDIPAIYKFHKKKSVDIQVDLIRFEKKY